MTRTTASLAAARDRPGGRDTAQRRTLVVLVIAQILGTVGLGVAPSIGILLAGEVTDNEAWAGLARTSSTLGAALLGIPLGNLAARRGRRTALATGWWVAAAGAALLVAAAQFETVIPLFLGLLMTGAGTAASLQARFAATDLAAPSTRARSLSLVVWMGAIGNVLGPNLGVPGEVVGEATGLSVYAAAFLIAAVASLLAGTVIFALLRPDPLLVLARRQRASARDVTGAGPEKHPAVTSEAASDVLADVVPDAEIAARARPRRGERFRRMVAALRVNRRARTALVALLTSQVVMVSLMTMTPVHIEHQGGSLTVVGLTISLHVAGMFGLSPVVGILVDRIGHRGTIAIGIVIFAGSLAAAIFAAGSLAGVMVSLVLLGLGWSFMNVAASALFATAIADRSRASAQGGADALSNLLGATTSFAAGPLMVATSFSVLGIVAAVLLVPILLLVLDPAPWRS
ncbi:MFS transporter [Brachybacterium sp. P6-10-X1]|uniref:MFS transporter n=1 Tax=Brachybacterium sp. P6-10-X1 TaxID=1903186 RepID=UPI000971B6F2|nr:MFS transporter [Brachybacterium sp. P6-10-X1]APX32816.1 MFS transporter [Brachybacterium sp. P6-10-X1]